MGTRLTMRRTRMGIRAGKTMMMRKRGRRVRTAMKMRRRTRTAVKRKMSSREMGRMRWKSSRVGSGHLGQEAGSNPTRPTMMHPSSPRQGL